MANDLDYAVVIGIEHYKDILQPLGGPHTDTKDFVKWLIDSAGGNLPYQDNTWSADPTNISPSNNILMLLSTSQYTPIKDDVDDWMDNMMNDFQTRNIRGRRLYFYFSGHGIGNSQMNSAMLFPKWTYSNRNYALSSEKYLLELVNRGAFEEIFFFMDCCRNRIAGVQGLPPSWAAALPANNNPEYLLYYASEFDAPAFEAQINKLDNLLPRGLFTEVLLNGLKGGAANKDGLLRITDLIKYVKRKLPELALSKGKTQIPKPIPAIDSEKQITGPFQKSVDIVVQFNTPGFDMVLEDADVKEVKNGNSSDGRWDLNLHRGEYLLRKKNESEGLRFYNDGIQTTFIYA